MHPEGLELSTFWFVERQEGQSRKSISFVWRHLRIRDVALPFFNCTQSCTRAIHSGHLILARLCWFSLKWKGFSRHRYDHHAIPQHVMRLTGGLWDCS